MSRFIYQGTFKDKSGNTVADGAVKVYLADGLVEATIYETETSAALISNQVLSDSNGHFLFWVDTGDYSEFQKFRIFLQKSGYESKDYDDIVIFPLGTIDNKNVSSSYNITNADEIILCTGTFTVQMPDLTSSDDKIRYIKNIGTGAITIEGNIPTETVDGSTSTTIYQYEDIPLAKDTDNSVWRVL